MSTDSFARTIALGVKASQYPDSVTASIPHDANTLTGTGTGGSAALQALANTGAPEVVLRAFYTGDTSTGSTLLDGQILTPNRQSWRGEGGKAKFVVAANDPCPNGYFVLSGSASYQATSAYTLYGNQAFGGMYLDGRAATANSKSPVGVVVAAPNYTVHDIYAFSMQTVVRCGEPGGSFSDGVRPDHLHIHTVHLNNQPLPVDFDPQTPSSSRYGIDFLRSNTGGDAVVIERCQSNLTGSGTSSKRCRFIGFRSATNLTVRHIINGDVYLYQSDAVILTSYFESGKTTACASSLTIRDSQYWMRNEVTVGTDVGCTPIAVIAPPLAVATASQAPASLVMDGVSFNYDASLTGGLGGYSLTNPNFSIDSTAYAYAEVKNCWRAAPYTNARGIYQRLGITCGNSDFDTYSHFASMSSYYQGSGTSGGNRWIIEAARGPIALASATTGNVIENITTLSSSGGLLRFKGATGRYFYRANALHDKIRGIGIAGAQEVFGDATNASGTLELRLGFDEPAGMLVRVFRGYSAGTPTNLDSYSYYVDVPILAAARLDDCGDDLASFPWVAIPGGPKTWAQLTAAGGLAAVNAGLSGGIKIEPGERTTASDSYGRCVAYSLTGAIPTTGGWRRGDSVMYPAATLSGVKRQVGWRRITNCTSASPTHVSGTDWTPIYNMEPQATPGVFASGSTTSVTVAAGQTRANVAPTGASIDVLNVSDNEIEGYWYLLEVRAHNPSSFSAAIKKSTGSTSATISLAGIYIVAWRQDLAIWEVGRLRSTMTTGAVDGTSTGLQVTIASSSTTATYPTWAERLIINTSTNALALTMPSDAEIDGTRRRISVTAYTNAVTLVKASTTSNQSTAINATGEWEAIFTGGVWKATKVGELPT